MVKVAKKIICIIMMAIIMIMPNLSKAASALETFVNSSEFGKVTSMPTDELSDQQVGALANNISSTLATANDRSAVGKDPKAAKEYLEGEYTTYMENWAGDKVTKTRSYIGYMLGSAWKTYKAAIEDDQQEKTPAEKFDEIYEEFTKLSEEEKKNTTIVSDFEKRLRNQYNKLTDEEKKENNREEKMNEVYELSIDTDTPISEDIEGNGGPGESTGIIGSTKPSASHTPDEIISEAQSFLNQATETTINGNNLKEGSSTLYNILLSLGIALAVIIGIYLGVKFMVSTVEDKAKVKEALIPYIAGCVIIFSSFIIWKLLITILAGIG